MSIEDENEPDLAELIAQMNKQNRTFDILPVTALVLRDASLNTVLRLDPTRTDNRQDR